MYNFSHLFAKEFSIYFPESAKLTRPEDSKVTFKSFSQAATCLNSLKIIKVRSFISSLGCDLLLVIYSSMMENLL